MGGVVASYLASKYRNVKKLFLLEPAFEYLTISAATNKIRTQITKATPNMPEAFEKGFRELVAEYKGAIKNVTVPVMFIHCSEDEVIPVSSSRNAYEKTPSDKKLFAVLEGGCHRVMDDPKLNTFVFKAIDSEIGYQLSWKEETRTLVKKQWNRLFKK